MLVSSNIVTREEVIAVIQELTAKLERRPTLLEVCSALKLASGRVGKLFGSYTKALKASGLGTATSWRLTMEQLLDDWREVARKLGKIPTVYEYRLESRYSERPLKHRFGSWNDIPAGLLEFGNRKQLWPGWEDVRELAQRYVDERTTSTEPAIPVSPLEDVDLSLMYGGPLTDSPMAVAPNNEMGVVLLFGALARKLGYAVLRVQKEFPDCEALREVVPNRWQRVRIEFEFESRNFLAHGHDPGGCDLIVCWEHNWEGSTVKVLELRKEMQGSP